MGGAISKPQSPHMERVADLKSRGICKTCVGRYLSLTKTELQELCPDDPFANKCVICDGLLARLDEIKQTSKDTLGDFPYHDIQVELTPNMHNRDLDICEEFGFAQACNIKFFVKASVSTTFRRSPSGPSLMISLKSVDSIRCRLTWPNLFIEGVYFKKSRRVSHAKFFHGFSITSLEVELTKALTSKIKCKEIKFSSAGREDMDVRMLGTGRPFQLSLSAPLPNPNLPPPKSLEEYYEGISMLIPEEIECNNGVSAKNIHLRSTDADMQPKHLKKYRCVVSTSKAVTKEMLSRLDGIQDLTISQMTPVRVSHRKPLTDREKTVVQLSYKPLCDRFFILDLVTSSGTYIKEFVNSDFGRTNPSLGSLLDPSDPVICELLQLDVVAVGEVN